VLPIDPDSGESNVLDRNHQHIGTIPRSARALSTEVASASRPVGPTKKALATGTAGTTAAAATKTASIGEQGRSRVRWTTLTALSM